MSSIGKQDTFWNLIKEYKIVVPKIQRDYVQGRENKTIEKNREEFVKELIGSLAENKPISLNFVYGTIQDSNEFIPIDGQQRLTTLFLLHLYVFAKKGNKDEIEVLQKKFSYQTRYTTNRFLEKLSEELPEMLNPSDRNNNLTDIIRDSGWYVTPWDNDPNIRSCLVMLQTIHETCNDILANNNDGISKFFNLLTGVGCPITFMWLQLDKSFGSDNQLYIRMNSRGKQLTDFENFKAELYEKILKSNGDEEKDQIIKDFKKNIDGDWYSLFWDAELCRETSNKNQDTLVKNKDEENIEKRATLIDRLLQHIFHWTIVSAICAYKDAVILTSASKNSTKEFERRLYSDLQPGCEIERVYIQEYIDLYQNWENYEEKDDLEKEERERREKERKAAFSKNIIEDFAYTLTFLSELKREEAEKIFRFIINDIFQINYGKKDSINFTIRQYSARVLLYSITKFAKDYKMNDKIKAFKSWYRVVLNLVSTQEIDSPEDFQSTVKALEGCDFNRDSNDIDESIKCWLKELLKKWEDNFQMKRAFRPAQVEEEILKLNLIKEGKSNSIDWESAIRNAEKTNFDQDYQKRDYFRGQIGFLLHMAGVEMTSIAELNSENLQNFKYYSKAVQCIFDYNNYWSGWEHDKITKKPTTVDEIKSAEECSFDNIFHRAMLNHGNYWVNAPGNNIKTFFVYNESHNNYDWRGAFRQHLADDQKGKPQPDDGWGVAVGCLKNLLDAYSPFDKYDQKYVFDFSGFKNWLEKLLADNQKCYKYSDGTAEGNLLDLLIHKPDCFKYIRNNYYIYWNDTEQEYLLMSLKRFRKDSFIDIKKELQGQTP